MPDERELVHVPGGDAALAEARSSLVARARKDAASLVSREGLTLSSPSGIVGRTESDEVDGDADPFMVGLQYETGDHIPQDYQLAAFWYRKAAEGGDSYAQNNLGALYEEGDGVPQDFKEAAFWYRKAAEQGNVGALCNLGSLYELGKGVAKDCAQAATWYREAADQYAHGTAPDYELAAHFYRKAADQGDPWAQLQLGLLYKTGRGVPKDDVQAAAWIGKASEHAMPAANYNLGLLYLQGRGVPHDDVEAYFRFCIATTTTWINDEYVRLREIAGARLTGGQRSGVRKRVDHWYAVNPHITTLF
ncbi:MAG: tetratricopeptide repeat protein [Acidobacteriaceae bacterium]